MDSCSSNPWAGLSKRDQIDLGLAIMSSQPRPYGIPRSLTEMACYCNCSRERMRQLVDQTLRKLRVRLASNRRLHDLVEHFTEKK